MKVGLIVVVGFVIVYVGFSYIGVSFGGLDLVVGVEKIDLFVKILINFLGKIGYLILVICVVGVCFIILIGFIVIVVEYFSNFIKVFYEKLVVIIIIIGFLFVIFGVNKIVIILVLVLVFLYLISIVLIILNFFCIKSVNVFKEVVLVLGFIGLYEGIFVIGIIMLKILSNIYNLLLFVNLGLFWLVLVLIVGICCYFIKDEK